MKYTKEDQQHAIKSLKAILKPGDSVYTILKHVSKSGMSRDIDVVIVDGEDIKNISYWVACALDYKLNNRGIRVGGCGMDMGFHLIYTLSSTLFSEGFDCIGDKCPSNDHVNREDNNHHRDGGYALIQKWI